MMASTGKLQGSFSSNLGVENGLTAFGLKSGQAASEYGCFERSTLSLTNRASIVSGALTLQRKGACGKDNCQHRYIVEVFG